MTNLELVEIYHRELATRLAEELIKHTKKRGSEDDTLVHRRMFGKPATFFFRGFPGHKFISDYLDAK